MILLSATNVAKLKVSGSNIELKTVVLRTQMNDSVDGKFLSVGLHPYLDDVSFKSGFPVLNVSGRSVIEAVEAVEASEGVEAVEAVEGVRGFNFKVHTYDLKNADGTYKDQSRLVAHQETKVWLEKLGYIADIIL
jgi:hypothetical protein